MTNRPVVASDRLPTGWAKTTLDSLATLDSTSGKKTLTKDAKPAGRYPVIDQGRGTAPGYVDDDSLVVVASSEHPVILFGDHTRVVKFVTSPFVPGADGTKLIRPLTAWHPKYAFYCLQGTPLPDRGYGRHFQYLRSAVLPLPPFAEQQRIADKLDTVLARVDACRDRLVRVAPLLKRFRQSVLSAATSGRLTEDWRRDFDCVETGAVLLSALQGDHARAGGHARGNASEPTEEAHDLDSSSLPATWAIATMLDACEPGRPITYGILKPGPELHEGIPYVRVADFPGNRLRLDSIKKTSPEIDEQFKRARLRAGDLLLSIRGSVGRVVEIPEVLANANITQDTARLSISTRVNRRYVLLALLDEATQRRMRAATRGVAVRGINIGDVRALQFPLPPMEEQKEIVRRVDTLFAFADRLEARLAHVQTAVNRLTPSLLARAFRGELVPQDPADEPAAELLKRLAASRPAPAANGRRARQDQPA